MKKNLTLVFFICLFIIYDCTGQSFRPEWVNTVSGTERYRATSIGKDASNNIYSAGHFTGVATFYSTDGSTRQLTGAGGNDAYIAKYAPDGKIIWVVKFGGSGSELINNMTIDDNGNVLVIGQYASTIDFGSVSLSSIGSEDMFLIKYNTNGGFVWAKSLGGSGIERGHQVTTDKDQNIFITGIYDSVIDLDPSSGVSQLTNNTPYFKSLIAKYDANGNLVWYQALGSGASGDGSSATPVTIDKNTGDVLIAGDFVSQFDFSFTNQPGAVVNPQGRSSYLARYTNNGTYKWVKTFPGTSSCQSICINDQLDIIMLSRYSGTFYPGGSTGLALTAKGNTDGLLHAYNSTGIFKWRKVIGGAGATVTVNRAYLDENQNIVICGILTGSADFDQDSPDGMLSPVNGGAGIFFGRYDKVGNAKTYAVIGGGCSLNAAYKVVATSNAFYITGGFCQTLDFDPSNCNVLSYTAKNSQTDAYLAKYLDDPPTNIVNTIMSPLITSFCNTLNPENIIGSAVNQASYQWQSAGEDGIYTNIQGATFKDYDLPVIDKTTYLRRAVTVCGQPYYSNLIIFSQTNVPITNNNITGPANAVFCGASNPDIIAGSVPQGGGGNYIYQWQSSADNLTFNDINGATGKDYDPPVIHATIYYRRQTTSTDCMTFSNSNAVTLTILPIPATPIPFAPTIAVCVGTSATFSIAAPLQGISYKWYPTSARTNLLHTGTSFTTDPINNTTNFYIEASNGSCISATLAQVQATILPPAPAPIVSVPEPSCAGKIVTLSINNPQAGIIYKWYTSSTGGDLVHTGSDFSTKSENITYYAEAVNSNCASLRRAAVINTLTPPAAPNLQNLSICPGNTAIIKSPNVTNTIVNWYSQSTGGNIITSGNEFTTPVLNSTTTYYAESVSSISGCVSNRTAVIVSMVKALQSPIVHVATTMSNSVTFSWNAISEAIAYEVSIDNGISFKNIGNKLSYTVTGIKTGASVSLLVKSKGTSACMLSLSSAAITGTALDPMAGEIFIPNVFSPNGDGKNDILFVRGTSIKSLLFNVYDQWGELIFRANDKSVGWDGTYRGKLQPVGVYAYYTEIVQLDGSKVIRKGTVTLLR
ncbi:gliding motility-associated C-terminal domain-containing protein [Pedobacter sp. MC2016-14]|uniref:gliding motility-associated C-terminal domain-containing protein n=1 Tax=Pedobacter sp. MC2016-14 TaxID=2897327 RepID=UPI001E64890C|nr:gliding motility-associated C-terminal domain-containing protein [Pedobacter sp. MC2016-14]MCD0490089.1 gliding motility-associated C-terminal domain-containing protein [Pedobacter sp. MC2016-14]